MEKLIMIGAGGYAKSVLDSLDYFNYRMTKFVDQILKKNISIYMNYFILFIYCFSLLDKAAILEAKKIGKTGFFNFNL